MATTLESIHSRFANRDSVVTDEESLLLMKNLRVSYNAESAILNYMTALAHICSYKPHLFEEIFVYPADALVCMGVENQFEAQRYIDYLLDDQENMKYRLVSIEARIWLIEQWPFFKDIVDKVLSDELKKALES